MQQKLSRAGQIEGSNVVAAQGKRRGRGERRHLVYRGRAGDRRRYARLRHEPCKRHRARRGTMLIGNTVKCIQDAKAFGIEIRLHDLLAARALAGIRVGSVLTGQET